MASTRVKALVHMRRLDDGQWVAGGSAACGADVAMFTTGAGSFWDVTTDAVSRLDAWARERGVRLEVEYAFAGAGAFVAAEAQGALSERPLAH